MNIIATVTARGTLSTVPDNDTAVDFCVTVDDRFVVEVTLLVDPASGKLDVWGQPANWCNEPDAVKGIESQIVAACRAAA